MAKLKQDPETTTFHFFNLNPKGQRAEDCVIRAIAGFTGKTWFDVYSMLSKMGAKMCRAMNEDKVFKSVLKDLGFVMRPMPRHSDNTKYTGEEFCKTYARSGFVYLLTMAGHLTFVGPDCKIYDIWDCSNKTVGNWWEGKLDDVL